MLSGVPTGPPPAPTLPPGDPPQPQPTFAWGNLGSAAGQGQLPEADSSRDTSLLPVLDPVAPLAGREGLLPDIPVERPTSAAGELPSCWCQIDLINAACSLKKGCVSAQWPALLCWINQR